MGFGEVMLWLFIFIVGSLAVSWIINGDLDSVGHSIKEFLGSEDSQVQTQNSIQRSNWNKIEFEGYSCKEIGALSKANQMSEHEGLEASCTLYCKQKNQYYQDYACEGNKFFCLCEK